MHISLIFESGSHYADQAAMEPTVQFWGLSFIYSILIPEFGCEVIRVRIKIILEVCRISHGR